ncbi:hypothetical protein V5O48_018115 [Marasmius crinis-equi]|uniref:Uncharacterized protein n=1 Tax=Marasmius crinis-equi TaxID=585013 RepID=A0ABR3EM36_9AGAR
MGAFVDNEDELDNLFHAGIPVWFIQPFSLSPDVRVDSLSGFIDDSLTHKLSLRFGRELDTNDISPTSNPVIYTGLAGKPERYLCMIRYIRSLFQYPSLLSSSEVRSSTSVIRSTRPNIPLGAFSTVGGTGGRTACSTKSKPYSKKTQNVGGTCGDANTINPFVDSSPLLPPPIPAWSHALRMLSHHNLSTDPPPGQVRGYFLPPPRILVALLKDNSKAEVICNWLKVRDVVVYRISAEHCRLTAKEWRSFLNVCGGNSAQASLQTATGIRHQEMLKRLKKFLQSHSLDLQYNQLPGLPAMWKNVMFSTSQLLERRVVQDITWELFELGF